MKNPVSPQDRILDIAVNLTRVGNWVADSYEQKQQLIKFFLDQTEEYLAEVRRSAVSKDFKPVLDKFTSELEMLRAQEIQKDKDWWAERALTWANILTHRAKLA